MDEHQPLTDSDLDVVSCRRVFEMVDGAQHVQSHVADVVCMEGGLIGNACHHHVGISDRLHLNSGQCVTDVNGEF